MITRVECIKQQVWEAAHVLPETIPAAEKEANRPKGCQQFLSLFDTFSISAFHAKAAGALWASQTKGAMDVIGGVWCDDQSYGKFLPSQSLAHLGWVGSGTTLTFHPCPSRAFHATSTSPLFTTITTDCPHWSCVVGRDITVTSQRDRQHSTAVSDNQPDGVLPPSSMFSEVPQLKWKCQRLDIGPSSGSAKLARNKAPIPHPLRVEALQDFPCIPPKVISSSYSSLSSSELRGCFHAARLELSSAHGFQFLILLSRTLLFCEQLSCVKSRRSWADERKLWKGVCIVEVLSSPR